MDTQNIQNPFLLARLLSDLTKLRNATEAARSLDSVVSNIVPALRPMKPVDIEAGLGKAVLLMEAAVGVESSKKKISRATGFKVDREGSWRRWVVITRETTAALLGDVTRDGPSFVDSVNSVAAELWEEGFGLAASEGDGGPGRPFRHRLFARVSCGHLVLVQSGGIDC